MRRMNSIIPALFAKLGKVKFLFEVNDDPYKKVYHEGRKTIFRFRTILSVMQDEINLKFCDKALIITKALSKKIFRFCPHLNDSKIMIMPSGSNTELFKPLNKNKCRFELGIDPKRKIIGFAGSLLKHQGIDTLIDAAPSILKQEPTTIFIVVGEGPMKKVWNDKVRRMNLGKAFMFTGQVDYTKMPIWISSMDICVAPFLRTAGLRSPVKIFDYMACGRPVVSSAIPGTTDVFSKSRAIMLIEPENSKVLAEALIDLFKSKKKLENMSKAGRLFIEMNYDRHKIIKNIINEINTAQNI